VPRVVNGLSFRVASPVRAVFTEDYDRPVAEYLRNRIVPGAEVWNVGPMSASTRCSWQPGLGRPVAWSLSNPIPRRRRSTSPAWIVMDIEGWEIAALHSARTLLADTRIAVELHPSAWAWSGHSRADLEQLLDEWRLIPRPLSGQRDVLGQHGQVFLEPRESTES